MAGISPDLHSVLRSRVSGDAYTGADGKCGRNGDYVQPDDVDYDADSDSALLLDLVNRKRGKSCSEQQCKAARSSL